MVMRNPMAQAFANKKFKDMQQRRDHKREQARLAEEAEWLTEEMQIHPDWARLRERGSCWHQLMLT